MVTTGTQILSTDLNSLRNKISDVMGTGVGTFGYGQSVNSSTVIAGQTVLKSHFDAIRFDIVNAYFHQQQLLLLLEILLQHHQVILLTDITHLLTNVEMKDLIAMPAY